MEKVKSGEKFNKDLILKLVLSAVPAVFWVIFLLNFWDKGIEALGFNATIFFFLILGLFVWVLYKEDHYTPRDLFWIVPLILISLGYSIYDNPFLKAVSLLVLSILFIIFYNQAFLPDKKDKLWDFQFVSKIADRFFSFLPQIRKSVAIYLNLIVPAGKNKNRVGVRVAIGLVLFLLIALTVFIPLLSSADAVFASKAQIFL